MLLAQIESHITGIMPMVISVCGAGGKTSALFDLAADFKHQCQNRQIVVLTTTRMMAEQPPRIDHFVSVDALSRIESLNYGITMVARGMDDQGKIFGFEPDDIDLWLETPAIRCGGKIILIEADGANKRPLKAPREGEPRFPGKTQIALGVLGADAFDLPAVGERIHRLPLFLKLTGLQEGDVVSVAAVTALIDSENGLFQSCPPGAQKILLVSKAEPRHEAFIQALKARTRLPVIVVEWGRWA